MCKSLLYPVDEEYMREFGICSICCTNDYRLGRDDFKKLKDKQNKNEGGSIECRK